MVAAAIRTVFGQPSAIVCDQADTIGVLLETKFPAVAKTLVSEMAARDR